MYLENIEADITMKETKRNFTHKGIVILTMSISYPHVKIRNHKIQEHLINNRIRMQIITFINYVSTVLYRQAIRSYNESEINDYPFNAHTGVLNYTVTYNQNCYLSIYRDQYEFTGGAHGITTRFSNTFDLKTGLQLSLKQILGFDKNYSTFIINQILMQADQNMKENGVYFEDYRDLIIKNFNPSSFYLVPDGIVFYFQQYDIAPYAAGIVEFEISYKTLNWKPLCNK